MKLSSWMPLDRVPLFAATLGALGELTAPPGAPAAAPLLAPPLTTAESRRAEMAAAGFRDVVVHEFEGGFDFASTAEMITSFSRSSAPVALARERLGAGWPAVEQALVERLTRAFGAGPQHIAMPALLTLGIR